MGHGAAPHHVAHGGNRRSRAGNLWLAESAWLAERTGGWVCSWREYLGQDDDPELTGALRRSEGTGRPAGGEAFLSKIGRLLGRDLAPKKPGPAPKRHKAKGR